MREWMALAIAGMFVAFGGAAMAMDSLDPDDAMLDEDRDGLINLLEYGHGTDPTNPDTDNGGVPDGWEVYYDDNRAYWDPNSADPRVKALWQAYARYDSDGDGQYDVNVDPKYVFDPNNKLDEQDGSAGEVDSDQWTNLREYQMGTDPTNPDTDGDLRRDDLDPDALIPGRAVEPPDEEGSSCCQEPVPSSQGTGQSARLGTSWESY